MSSAEEYLFRMGEIVGDDLFDGEFTMNISLADGEEARKCIDDLRYRRQRVESLKREISATIADIKAHHTEATAYVGTGLGSIVTGLVLGHRWTGKMNNIHRELIRSAKVSKVAPYEKVKVLADRICHHLDQARDRIQASDIMDVVAPLAQIEDSPEPSGIYAYVGEQVKGPYSHDQLVALHDVGTIADDTLCCQHGTEDWRPYGDIKGA